jgi:hypothetical protein
MTRITNGEDEDADQDLQITVADSSSEQGADSDLVERAQWLARGATFEPLTLTCGGPPVGENCSIT